MLILFEGGKARRRGSLMSVYRGIADIRKEHGAGSPFLGGAKRQIESKSVLALDAPAFGGPPHPPLDSIGQSKTLILISLCCVEARGPFGK